MKWYEIDLGWGLIRTLAAFGLASDIYVRNRRWKTTDATDVDDADPIAVSPPEVP